MEIKSNDPNATSTMKYESKSTDLLENLLPATRVHSITKLLEVTVADVDEVLSSYEMYRLGRLTVATDIEDLETHLQERLRVFLASAYQAGQSVTVVYRGRRGLVDVLVGFEQGGTDDQQQIFQGIFPGAELTSAGRLDDLIGEHEDVGIASGIPILHTEESSHRCRIADVIRSLGTSDFDLVLRARPIPESQSEAQLDQLQSLRARAHARARNQESVEESRQKGTTRTKSTSSSHSVGAGAFIGVPGAMLGGHYSYTSSDTRGTSSSEGMSRGRSLSREQLDPEAEYLAEMAKRFAERVQRGLNVGYWETTLSFGAESAAACSRLAGSLRGAFSAPDPEALPLTIHTVSGIPDRRLLLPKSAGESRLHLFPTPLSSCMTSQELAATTPLPAEPLPGYDVLRRPELSLTDRSLEIDALDAEEAQLGYLVDHRRVLPSAPVALSEKALNKHVFVCGVTGSGKTTTVKTILDGVEVPYLVIESVKREYRQLFSQVDDARVYTVGDGAVAPLAINPFYLPHGVAPQYHIDLLKALFNACFSLYGPMPYVLEQCLYRIYEQKGWDLERGEHPLFAEENALYDREEHLYLFPTLADLIHEVRRHVETSDYAGELKSNIKAALVTRLQSLATGSKGLMFNTTAFPSLEMLFEERTVLELEPLADDDDKAFFLGLLLILLDGHRKQTAEQADGLQHVLVIEEAHRLLKNVSTERTSEMLGNPRGKAVETFCNVIAEMRSRGQGIVIVEQIPSKIAPDVVKNTNTKVVHRLASPDDQHLMAGSMGLDQEGAAYLNQLRVGEALIHKEGMERPAEVKVQKRADYNTFDDAVLANAMKECGDPAHLAQKHAQSLHRSLGKDGTALVIRYVNSLLMSTHHEVPALFEEVLAECKRLAVSANSTAKIGEDAVERYLTHRVSEVFMRGYYALDAATRRRLRLKRDVDLPSFIASIVHQDEGWRIRLIDLQEAISQQDDFADAKQSVRERVARLAAKAANSASLKTSADWYRLVKGYFLNVSPSAIVEIVGRAQAQCHHA